MTAAAVIEELDAARRITLERYSSINDSDLEEQREWRGAPSQMRFLLAWLSEGCETRRIRIIEALAQMGRRPSGAQRIAIELARARGQLLGELVGLQPGDLEREPGAGEWSIRHVLGHVIAVDLRYLAAVRHAVERADAGGTGPLRPDENRLPGRTGEAESVGSAEELVDRLRDTRRAVMDYAVSIPDNRLDAPTNWTSWDMDVRFRLHRFPSHDREHAIQIRKARHWLGLLQTEAQMLLADAMVELETLKAVLLVADGAIDSRPPGGDLTISDLVREGLEEERRLVE
jgi:DinB superfamily